jgi:hypothetical protein
MLIRFEQASSDGENFSLAIEKAYLNEAPILDFGTGASSRMTLRNFKKRAQNWLDAFILHWF